MAGTALSIKLRCTSWQQLATIYRRDLSRGTMFLKATSQPAIGTVVRIELALPRAPVPQLSGPTAAPGAQPARGAATSLGD